MINLVVSSTTQSLHLANRVSYPQAERTSDTCLSHFLSTTESKKIFIEWIWLGKILANGVQFAKFAKVFPRQNFALYGILACRPAFVDHEMYCGPGQLLLRYLVFPACFNIRGFPCFLADT